MTNDNDQWEAACGVICPECNTEVFRLIDGRCIHCAEKKVIKTEEQIEKKATRSYYRQALNKGDITLSQAKAGDSRHK